MEAKAGQKRPRDSGSTILPPKKLVREICSVVEGIARLTCPESTTLSAPIELLSKILNETLAKLPDMAKNAGYGARQLAALFTSAYNS